MPLPSMTNHRYTIGWISPLPLEAEAARLVFDPEPPVVELQYQDAYYHGGRIGEHYVVMGISRKTGLTSAAALAEKMHAGFPNIKNFLVVGIAGGVPSYGSSGNKKNIVLGDVVISSPRGKYGGVVQYDKGAWRGEDQLIISGCTPSVSSVLLAAINNFCAAGSFQTKINEVLQQMRKQHMRKQLDDGQSKKYDDLGEAHDRLYGDDYQHQGDRDKDCSEICDPGHLLTRTERGPGAGRARDNPHVHFGNVASSSQLQISAIVRKRFQSECDVLCFEMEAAGAIEEYPCVMVRGICDYADSHKNKDWQNYAAATAAACARCLLSHLPPSSPSLGFTKANDEGLPEAQKSAVRERSESTSTVSDLNVTARNAHGILSPANLLSATIRPGVRGSPRQSNWLKAGHRYTHPISMRLVHMIDGKSTRNRVDTSVQENGMESLSMQDDVQTQSTRRSHRAQMVWTVTIVVVVLAAVVGGVVGGVLKSRKPGQAGDMPSTSFNSSRPDSSTTAISSVSVSATSTTASLSQVSSTPIADDSLCPARNNETYTEPTTRKSFLIECNFQYTAGDYDMKFVYIDQGNGLAECIALCATNTTCLDVSLSGSACYLKNTLGKRQATDGFLNSARLLNE